MTKLLRTDFDPELIIAEQEAYSLGMIDEQEKEYQPDTMPDGLRAAYIDGYRDAQG